jgi:Type I site-specific restriction-modification system, R (restriction) subunit and related helicases
VRRKHNLHQKRQAGEFDKRQNHFSAIPSAQCGGEIGRGTPGKSKEGTNFLIQHSAGSGKSNSIAWLTYRLANLHDEDDNEMFQSVFVVTDRRILNKQLQDTILGFEHTTGQVVTIENKDTSDKLLEAINNKKKIIITTLHRFPLVYKELDNHAGKRFAIIVDEAHSSQSGKSAEKTESRPCRHRRGIEGDGGD